MTTVNFQASVDDWTRQSLTRMTNVFKDAAGFVIDDVVDRTPVDTGFLRASITVTMDAFAPVRSDFKGLKGVTYAPTSYTLVIEGLELGDTLYASFTAAYGPFVEYGSNGRAGVGMVRLAAQNWQQHVARAIQLAKAGENG